jgi:rhodanese-related sulfurtransferase
MKTVAGIALVAAVATAGDAIWYTFGVRHTMAAGLTHGALLLAAVGGVLGAASGHLVKGLPIGALAGIGGAAAYFALVALVDRRTYGTAIPAAWVITWLLLATLDGRWLRAPARRTWGEVAARGLIAATLGGIAFALVLTTLWGRPPAGGRNYVVQFLAWAFAWAPGLVALTAGGAASASIAAATLLERIDRGDSLRILDVRSPEEFAAGHVPGAVNVPYDAVSARINDVLGSGDEELILYCGHGPRAYLAASALRRAGRTRIVYLKGHWAAWQRAGLRVERG